MTRVEHYKGLHTNIDKLYREIKQELENEKNLRIVAEMKGGMNEALRSITCHYIVIRGAQRQT